MGVGEGIGHYHESARSERQGDAVEVEQQQWSVVDAVFERAEIVVFASCKLHLPADEGAWLGVAESGKLQAILVDAECEAPRLGIADFHVGCIDSSVHFALKSSISSEVSNFSHNRKAL